jgi:hypothetical protein
MDDDELRVAVLLSMQLALLGCVGPTLRLVACRWSECVIEARAVFDGEISEEDRETMSEVETELMAHFPHHPGVAEMRTARRAAID